MANTITKAVQYINNQAEVSNMFKKDLICGDLVKPLAEHKGNVVSYDKMSFASYTMGTYSRETGCPTKDITFERVSKTLTQDKGDSLGLDIMDKEEAKIADGIIGVYNFYDYKVAVPTIDAYAFSQLTSAGATDSVHTSITVANIVGLLMGDFATMRNKRVKTEECILYIGATELAKLEEATFGKGILTLGAWNGHLDSQVRLFKGAKVVEVPDNTLGENVAWVLVHPLAFAVIPVLARAEYKDNIPGFVGKAQVDVRHYFDAWREPTGEDGIVVALKQERVQLEP